MQTHVLSIGFINMYGQTGLTCAKQAQIETFLLKQKIDILNLQEIDISSDTFSSCDVICSSYNIISNNAPSKYGTACLVKTDFVPQIILFDCNGH